MNKTAYYQVSSTRVHRPSCHTVAYEVPEITEYVEAARTSGGCIDDFASTKSRDWAVHGTWVRPEEQFTDPSALGIPIACPSFPRPSSFVWYEQGPPSPPLGSCSFLILNSKSTSRSQIFWTLHRILKRGIRGCGGDTQNQFTEVTEITKNTKASLPNAWPSEAVDRKLSDLWQEKKEMQKLSALHPKDAFKINIKLL